MRFQVFFFYKELVINNLKFVPVGAKEEKELVDLGKETKWLGKECRDAKKQVKKTIEFVETGVLPSFKNVRKYEVKIKREG